MIVLTITSDESGVPFVIRFQKKVERRGELIWADSDLTYEVGKSQRYGIDEHVRLIVEASPAERQPDA